MLAKIISGAVMGVDGYKVDVEVDVSSGLPGFDIVGLPDSAVKESRERVRTAVRNAGFPFPVKQITVNLAPADTRKSGPAFDLPVAVGILICTDTIKAEDIENSFFAGELSLDGAVRPVNGMLPMVMAARSNGIHACFVPSENAQEAALVDNMTVYPLTTINSLVNHFKEEPIKPVKSDTNAFFSHEYDLDFSDVAGQSHVKRALEIAAAGYHNVLLIGPPGAGKTMMARRMPSIMPELSLDESMEITKIYSIAGLIDHKNALMNRRPFRTPHHTASHISLTGGGRIPMPGEISLAHNGVLFLDELPEFQKKALEILRQPMEDGHVTVSRVGGVCTYPSSFLLMASMNPCPCGYYGTTKCRCAQHEIIRYLSKISGPLLDRLDLQCEAVSIDYNDINNAQAETSREIKNRVVSARQRQQERFANENIRVNAHMTAPLIKRYCVLGGSERQMLRQAFERMGLSMRAYHKILKTARTIADLAGEKNIGTAHLAEAISYRELDRKYWQ